MRCEYLAYKVAQVWRISMQRGWEGSSGKLFPGLLSLRCCSFGCSWTVSMHPISQRSRVWGSELKAHQTHCTGHEPVCLESKNYIHHWIFLRALGSASQTTSSLETSGSTQPEAGGRAAHGHGCTSKWDVLGQSLVLHALHQSCQLVQHILHPHYYSIFMLRAWWPHADCPLEVGYVLLHI